MKDYASAKAQFDAILAYDPPKAIRERHKKTFDRTREYLEKISSQSNY
jgi:hypothetical protein